MTDAPAPAKRQGNYVPARIKLIEVELARRYAAGETANALAREYKLSVDGVRKAMRRQGVAFRDKAAAGRLARTVDYSLSDSEITDTRPIAQQVAEALGYSSHKGLSYDRTFQSAVAKERRRRSEKLYREIDRRRKAALDRIPAWQDRKQLDAFYGMARDLGLDVDHINPLQGETLSGLNVISNLRLISPRKNQAKQNKVLWKSDPLVGIPVN